MTIRQVAMGDKVIAVIEGEEQCIATPQDALDVMATVRYTADADQVIFQKHHFAPDFYSLRTGLLGEVLQKFTNYRLRLAIVGDFTAIQSKPMRDFIYECNQGRQVCFAATQAEALERLSQ